MKITVEFSSLEEMDTFCNGVAVGSGAIKKEVSVTKKTVTKKEAPAGEPVKEEVPAEETPVTDESPKEEATPQYSLEDVRACLGALQKAGKKDLVKELLQSFGASKLPEVNPDDYPALMAKAGEIDAQ